MPGYFCIWSLYYRLTFSPIPFASFSLNFEVKAAVGQLEFLLNSSKYASPITIYRYQNFEAKSVVSKRNFAKTFSPESRDSREGQ